MSMILQNALKHYTSGKYKQSLSLLEPLLKAETPTSEALLLAAQCHVKTAQFAEAARFYAKASEKDADRRQMLTVLAAAMMMKASDSAQALSTARIAARSSGFDIEAEETFRRFLRASFCLDECMVEDIRFLMQLKSGDARTFAVENPFDNLTWCTDESLNAKMTRLQKGKAFTPQSQVARRAMPHAFADRIRIGYLSSDLSDQHATMRLFQGVILAHDRQRFDVTLFCHTPADVIGVDKGMRKRYPNIVPIGHLTDEAAVKLMRSRQIDILVDLKGHTKGTRIDLINRGGAPIQAAYLGFPGSARGIDCDYAITDAIVTPETSKPHYHEKLCRLPECYQANDDRYRVLPEAMSRAQAGLPETGIVFASFNAVRKITPATARLWVKILRAVPDSILWLMCEDTFAQDNLLRYLADANIGSQRVVFAKSVAYDQHVARLQAADIGLDTFPYNGHTTTSDKLWAGLPVPTMRGRHFASRVSESLLLALDMPELIAADAKSYVELCVTLATDRDALKAIREKLSLHRFEKPLFDTERFTRHLERAYEMMVARAKDGLEPDHIDVPALPARAASFAHRRSDRPAVA